MRAFLWMLLLALAACSERTLVTGRIGTDSQNGDNGMRPPAAQVTPQTNMTLAGIVSAWSSAPHIPEPAQAGTANVSPEAVTNPGEVVSPPISTRDASPTAEQVLLQARVHAKASVRILELQAQQDPTNAAAYLSQAAKIAARNEPVLPPQRREPKEVTEYQHKLNAFMSAKIDQLAAKQKIQQEQSPIQSVGASQKVPGRAGDSAGPRPGDIAANQGG